MKAWPLLVLLAACGPIPRDPEGTLDRVRETRVVRVGVVEGPATWRPLLARVAAATGARPQFEPGALEPLLLKLEEGEVDLVAGGVFDEKTPWLKRVTLGPVIRREGKTAHHLVARNGENAWVMLIEREGRALGYAK